MPVDNTEPLSVYRAGPGYARCLADMILLASRSHHKRGFLDHLTGLPEPLILNLLARLAMHPAQLWGRIDNTYVALVDGVCSGTVTVREDISTPDYPFSPHALRDLAPGLGLTDEDVAGIVSRQQAFVNAMPAVTEPATPGTWLVEYLGVRRENRAGGVARGLMARVEQDLRAAGAKALELYCDLGNTRAERLFSTLGFTLVREYRYGPGMEIYGEGVSLLKLEL